MLLVKLLDEDLGDVLLVFVEERVVVFEDVLLDVEESELDLEEDLVLAVVEVFTLELVDVLLVLIDIVEEDVALVLEVEVVFRLLDVLEDELEVFFKLEVVEVLLDDEDLLVVVDDFADEEVEATPVGAQAPVTLGTAFVPEPIGSMFVPQLTYWAIHIFSLS